mmetsp:Transcript_115295/g.264797  ORF Transcript_115295/g.264797 Transcript_115295/m.264797 type:complete len:310 (+) Transcript_115295:820-1749(+)
MLLCPRDSRRGLWRPLSSVLLSPLDIHMLRLGGGGSRSVSCCVGLIARRRDRLQQRCIRIQLRSARRAALLHHQPALQALHVENVAAGQLFGPLPQFIAANNASVRAFHLFGSGIREALINIADDLPVFSERSQSLRQLPRNLDDVRQQVDGQTLGVLEKEGEHKKEEDGHGDHITKKVHVEQIRRLGRPPVLQPQINKVNHILGQSHHHQCDHRQSLKQDPSVERRGLGRKAIEDVQSHEIASEEHQHEGHQLDIHDQSRYSNFKHVRHPNLGNQMEHLHKEYAADALDQVHCVDLLPIDGWRVEDQE